MATMNKQGEIILSEDDKAELNARDGKVGQKIIDAIIWGDQTFYHESNKKINE